MTSQTSRIRSLWVQVKDIASVASMQSNARKTPCVDLGYVYPHILTTAHEHVTCHKCKPMRKKDMIKSCYKMFHCKSVSILNRSTLHRNPPDILTHLQTDIYPHLKWYFCVVIPVLQNEKLHKT